jgi:hypothetical protein
MTDQLYFQWQNDVLRTTIYPLRDMKLRDFLVYFKEIELWEEYQKKNLAVETEAYNAKKKQVIARAAQAYTDLRGYFLLTDVRKRYTDKYNVVDEEVLKDIHAFHNTFASYLPKLTDPRKENYFVSQQVLYWQQYRKDYLKRITTEAYKLDIMKRQPIPNPNIPEKEKRLAFMQNTSFKMVDDELEQLYTFVSVSKKIWDRKQDLFRAVQDAQKQTDILEPQLDRINAQLKDAQMLQQRTSTELTRLKSPPALVSVQTYFSTLDVSAQIRATYKDASQSLIDSVNAFHKDLTNQLTWSKSLEAKLGTLRSMYSKLEHFQKDIVNQIAQANADLRSMPPTWSHRAEREALRNNLQNVSLPAAADELKKMADFLAAFEASNKTPLELAKMTQAKEQELAGINGTLSRLGNEAKSIQSQIDRFDGILNRVTDKQLAEYEPDPTKPVTMNDIVLLQVDAFKEQLENIEGYELLELVVKELQEHPNKYPRWLQYMVIHFSGMRYASAHGSWADPKDLLGNLETFFIGKDLKGRDAAYVESLCREKLECYVPSDPTMNAMPPQPKPALALATDEDTLKTVATLMDNLRKALDRKSTSAQRSALVNLRIEEENYRIDHMKPDEILQGLVAHKDDLPDWMWKEIVKLTDLRVNMVTDKNWERLTPQEQAKQYSAQDAEFRQMMEDWKQKFLTGWREEHDASDKLIVTRAVCNEVAEHIQHLRGHSPWGGLTAKPKWYKSQKPKYPDSYFELPSKMEDFKTGASLLWLRFVNAAKQPSPWQIAEPINTDSGKELIPAKYLGRRTPSPNGTTPWSYNRSDPITRSRNFVNDKGVKFHQDEILRWIHEATVVTTALTANGKVVLTFETALPSDDPRLSTIGVFKRYVDDLTWDLGEDTFNPAFVGYVPEGQVPEDKLADMLDWDKILTKPQS